MLVRERSSLVGRRRDEQDGYLRAGRRAEIRRRAQPFVRGRYELLEPRLLDRCTSLVQESHRFWVDVDAQDLVSLAREHGGERCTELSESDDGDPHHAATRLPR